LLVLTTTEILQNDTHRLIPSRYADESVLAPLADSEDELEPLYVLDGATNGRLIAEAGKAPGISVHELVFGIPNSNVVNAAYCHPNPNGCRFSGTTRGAWYAGFSLRTSTLEVSYHVSRWLSEVHWEPGDWVSAQQFPYVDFLADFRGAFHDMRGDGDFNAYLNPNSYVESQVLAGQLLAQGAIGIVYPSVRHAAGTCIVSFRPALVMNVRKGGSLTLIYASPTSKPRVKHG
jgi:RES domain